VPVNKGNIDAVKSVAQELCHVRQNGVLTCSNPVIKGALDIYRTHMNAGSYEQFLTAMICKLIDGLTQASPHHADYSQFPFDMYSTDELGAMFFQAIVVGSQQFADAVREQIKRRKE
jgi:hypothetical protein